LHPGSALIMQGITGARLPGGISLKHSNFCLKKFFSIDKLEIICYNSKNFWKGKAADFLSDGRSS
ncbi:MAG: hypothetical protein K2O42_05915, partial [Oscillospiraceae bacterium]|nr:hypothetical protein [Oscillospiraceae bacterium]